MPFFIKQNTQNMIQDCGWLTQDHLFQSHCSTEKKKAMSTRARIADGHIKHPRTLTTQLQFLLSQILLVLET